MKKTIILFILFIPLVFANQKNISLSFDANYINMTDGCKGEIGFMPKLGYELQVCAYNSSEYVGCKLYFSNEYNKSTNISTDYFVTDIDNNNLSIFINWSRIKYIDMNNSGLNGYNDSGGSSSASCTARCITGDIGYVWGGSTCGDGDLSLFINFNNCDGDNPDDAYYTSNDCTGTRYSNPTSCYNSVFYYNYINTPSLGRVPENWVDSCVSASLGSCIQFSSGWTFGDSGYCDPSKSGYAYDSCTEGTYNLANNTCTYSGDYDSLSQSIDYLGYGDYYTNFSDKLYSNGSLYIIFAENNIPITTATLSPKPAVSTDNLSVTITYLDYYDNNTWQLNQTKWYNNSLEISNLENLTSISYTNTTDGETWTVSVRVYDGFDWSDWENDSVVIADSTPPDINNIYFSNTNIYTTDSLTIYFNITDLLSIPNSDSCTFTLQKDNQNLGGGIANPYNFSTNIKSGDIISRLFSSGTFTTGTLNLQKVYCDDGSGNIAENLSVGLSVTITEQPVDGGDVGGGGGSGVVSGLCGLNLNRPTAGSTIGIFNPNIGEFSQYASFFIKNTGDFIGTYDFSVIENTYLEQNCEFDRNNIEIKPNIIEEIKIRCKIDEDVKEGKIEISGCGSTGTYRLYVDNDTIRSFFQQLFTADFAGLKSNPLFPLFLGIGIGFFVLFIIVPFIIFIMKKIF